MARSIKLTRYNLKTVNIQYLSAYRLKVKASQPSNVDPRIFLFRRDPVDPYTGLALDYFLGVASPVDMVDYPPENPRPGAQFPFFRRDEFEIDLRSTSTAEDTWTLVKQETQILLQALDRLELLIMTEETVIGDSNPIDPFTSVGSESFEASESSEASQELS